MLKIKLCIYLMLLIASNSPQAAEKCEYSIAKLVSTKGRVEKQTLNQSKWQQVSQFEFFCQGDKIRTLQYSWVKLKFIHEPETIVELEQNSALTFPKIEAGPSLPFNLLKEGALLIAKVFIDIKNRHLDLYSLKKKLG